MLDEDEFDGRYTVLWCNAQRHARCVELLRAENFEVADPGVLHKIRVGKQRRLSVRWVYEERPLFPQYLIVKLDHALGPRTLAAMARRWMGFGVSDGKVWKMDAATAERWGAYRDTHSADGSFPIGTTVTAKGRGHENLHGVALNIRSKKRDENGAWVYECELPEFLTKTLLITLPEEVLRPA